MTIPPLKEKPYQGPAPEDEGCPGLCSRCGAFMSDWYYAGGGLWACALCHHTQYAYAPREARDGHGTLTVLEEETQLLERLEDRWGR